MKQFTNGMRLTAKISLLLLTAIPFSCSQNKTNEEKAIKSAIAFAEAFYNFEYQKARDLCAEGATAWLDMFVSNIKKEDISAINQLECAATIEISKNQTEALQINNDSSITVLLKVKDAYVMDTIGKVGQLVPEQTIRIPLIVQKGVWKIKMEDLPQNEM